MCIFSSIDILEYYGHEDPLKDSRDLGMNTSSDVFSKNLLPLQLIRGGDRRCHKWNSTFP